MTWETALRSRLLEDGAVESIVGSKVAWAVAEQRWALPYIVVSTVSDVRDQHFGGFQSFRASRAQIDCYATTQAQAVALREAALAAVADGGTFSGVRFGRITDVSVRDLSANADTVFVHRDSIEAQFWHE